MGPLPLGGSLFRPRGNDLRTESVQRFGGDALEISFRCLSHPLSICSIGLLVVNDHWLKLDYPSYVTGKLSDFAGLFFFPFLLVAFLALILSRTKTNSHAIGVISFLVTAIWFSLVKTTDAANAMTTDFVSALLGWRVQIALDPSDAIALISLLPAWRLWKHAAQDDVAPRRFAWLAVLIAGLATMATSSAPVPPGAVRVVAESDSLFICCPGGYTTGGYAAAKSTDNGRTWLEAVSSVPSQIKTSPTLPLTRCVPSNAQVCYRIGQGDYIEESHDGGNTWQVTWRIPEDRYEFMDRMSQGHGLFSSLKTLDRKPYDLIITEYEKQYVVVVAMGNEGIVVKTNGGVWERIAVLQTQPTPIAKIELLYTETNVLFLIALIFPCLLTAFLSAIQTRMLAHSHQFRSSLRFERIFLSVGAIFLIFLALLFVTPFGETGFILSYLFIAPIIVGLFINPIGGVFLAGLEIASIFLMFRSLTRLWRAMLSNAENPGRVTQAINRTVLTALGIFFVGEIGLNFWTTGVIGAYRPALYLAAALTLVTIVLGWLKAVESIKKSVEPVPVVE